LRNIQVAHSLIPWNDPTDQLWAHHLLEFAEVVFDFAITLEAALAEATGVTLKDLRKNADAFEASAGQFWRALTTLKFLADGEPPNWFPFAAGYARKSATSCVFGVMLA
jgi:hypothetical protein